MFSFFNYMLLNLYAMWLKICYVLKNNKDKLLGYIHIPTKQDNFNEEIRWVQARQNGRKKEKLRCVTPELDEAEENQSPILKGNEFHHYDSGETLTYQEIDNITCAQTVEEEEFADEDNTDEIPSPTSNENENNDLPRKDFSVEIRYEPRSELERSDGIHSPSPIEELPEEEELQPPFNRGDSDEEEIRAHLEQISFNNKIRFIYSRRDDGNEEILSVPSRQEEFNRGIRYVYPSPENNNFSSSPKKDKSLNKSYSRKFSPRNDATFTVPTNSADLKEIIYHQWLEKKKVQTKEEIKAKMLARKKAAQLAETEANDRKVTAQKIYDAWNDSKTGKILTEKEMKHKAKQAEKEKMEEALQRKKDAEKYFEAWKREKDEKIKKMHLQKKKQEKQKDKESFQLKRQTSEEALKAFETWKVQKTKEIAEMKKKEDGEKAKVGEEKLLAFEKKQEALRVYEQWKSNSKKSPRPKSPQLIQRSWLPAGRNLNNTIPEKVQPVIIRNRNVSR